MPPAPMRPAPRLSLALLVGAGAVVVPAAVAAQEFEGGTRIIIGLEQRVDAGGNLGLTVPDEGSSLLSATRLSFGLTSRSRTQTLDLLLSSALRIEDRPGGDGTTTDLSQPALTFAYTREVPSALLAVTANYREEDVDTFDIGGIIDDGGVIVLPDTVQGGGTRSISGATVRLEVGRTSPLGFAMFADYAATDYQDTTDPDLNDIKRIGVGIEARLRFSDVLTGTAALGFSREDEDNLTQTVTERSTASFGLAYAISDQLDFSASLGLTEIRTVESGVVDRTSGPVARFGLAYGLRNGTATADLTVATDADEGQRVTVEVGRAMDLPTGSLSARIGLTAAEGGSTEVIGGLAWSQDLRDGQITVRLERAVSFDDDESTVSTAFVAGWDRRITALSSVGLDFSYAVSDAPSETITQTGFGATYSYALTDDWSLDTGLRYRVRDDADGHAESPSVFLAIGRSFEFRP